MIDHLLQNVLFQYNERIKRNQTKHLGYLSTYRVEYCTISAFIVRGLHGLYRSQKLHKQISAEFKLPLSNLQTTLYP